MIFQINHLQDEDITDDNGVVVIHGLNVYSWMLAKTKNGEVTETICRSVKCYDSERECRSAIAAAKIAMKGASRCKVVSPDG